MYTLICHELSHLTSLKFLLRLLLLLKHTLIIFTEPPSPTGPRSGLLMPPSQSCVGTFQERVLASLAMSSKISTHHYTIISSGTKASLETQEQGL